MLSLDSTLRFIRKRVSFYLLLSPVFSLTGVLDSDIVIASFPHIHMSNLFPLLCLRYSTVFWQCQPCLLIILCFFCEYNKFTHFNTSCQAFCVCVFSVNLQNPPKKVIDILNSRPYNSKSSVANYFIILLRKE